MSCTALHGVELRCAFAAGCAPLRRAGACRHKSTACGAAVPTPASSPPRHRLLPRRWRTVTTCCSSALPNGRKYSTGRVPLLVAAAALINETGHVLLSQRSAQDKNNALKFEFPGGKLEGDESPEEALCRELEEELDITVAPGDCHPLVFSTAPGSRKSCLTLLLFTVRKWSGVPSAKEGQPSLVWVSAEQLNTEAINMPAMDEPLLPAVRAAMRAIGCCASDERVASAAGEASRSSS